MRCAATSRSWIRRISVASSRRAVLLALVLILLAPPAGAQERASLAGRILRPVPGDTVPVAGARVVLHRVGQDTQGPVDSARTGADGAFRFAVSPDTTAIFLVSARYGGIEFFSQPVTFREAGPPPPVTLLISDTSSRAPVGLGGRFLVIGAPDTERRRTAVDLFIIRNPGHLTRVAPDSMTATWQAVLPRALAHRVATAGSEVSPSAVRFRGDTVLVFAPLSPGEKQLLLEHSLPAEWSEWSVPLGEDTTQVQVVSEEPGVVVTGAGLAPAEAQVVDGRPLSRWMGQGTAGATVRVGFPGGTTSERDLVRALVVLAMVALAVFAFAGLRRGRRRTGALSVLMALSLAHCATPPKHGGLSVVDDVGDTVSLQAPARRVVSLIPAATELLFAIGAGGTVVGRTDWCDYPEAAVAVPSVGGGLEPNIEAVVAARPDLVLLYPSPQTAAAAARLRSLGIPAMQWRTDGLADLARGASRVGRLVGAEDAARAVMQRADSALQAVTRRRESPPRVLALAWDQPPIAIGRGSFLNEVIVRAGGENLFADVDAGSAPVSLEAIAARDPDAILAVGELPDFAGRPEWQVVRAVREGRFLVMHGSEFQRPTPRAALAVARLAAALDSLGHR